MPITARGVWIAVAIYFALMFAWMLKAYALDAEKLGANLEGARMAKGFVCAVKEGRAQGAQVLARAAEHIHYTKPAVYDAFLRYVVELDREKMPRECGA